MGKKHTKTKKAKIKKQEKDFVPGTETEDQFNKVLSLLSQWIKAGIVSVEVDVDGDVNFILPKEMDRLLETQVPRDLGHKKVQEIIKNEIPPLIDAGLRRNPKQVIRMTMSEKLYKKIDAMVKRSEKAVANLVDSSLKERIMLRRTTPGYIFNEINSIQSTYHVEVKEGEKIDLPFISLELTLAKPRSGYIFSINPRERTVRPYLKDELVVAFDLHKDDIKDLIKKLNKIEEKINKKGE